MQRFREAFPIEAIQSDLSSTSQDNVRILQVDDDVLFLDDLTPFYATQFFELPDNWDILYLGVSPREPQERYSKHLFRIRNAVCMHAYAMNNNNGCVDFVLEHRQEIVKIDDFFAKVVQPKFNCFMIYPILATQFQFQSDTCKRSDVSTIVKNVEKFCI